MHKILSVLFATVFLALSAPVAHATVLVFGGTGRLGAEVVHDLIAAGEDVVVFVRTTSDRSRLDGLDVDYVVGDLMDKASVANAFAGRDIDAVINTVALRPGETSPYIVGEQNIDAATKGKGLAHMILFSATGAGDSKSTIPPQFYEPFKKTYEDRTVSEQIIKDSGTPYTFIRLGTVHDKEATGSAYLIEEPVLGPVTRGDAAELAVDCLRASRCVNKTFHATDDSLPLIPEEEH